MNEREILEEIIRVEGRCVRHEHPCNLCPVYRGWVCTTRETAYSGAQKLLSEMEVTKVEKLKTEGLTLLEAARAVEEGKARDIRRKGWVHGFFSALKAGVCLSASDILATDWELVDPKVSTEEVIRKAIESAGWNTSIAITTNVIIAHALRAAGKLKEGE